MDRVSQLLAHINQDEQKLEQIKTDARGPMEVAGIFMYPIKSCAPVEFKQAAFLKRGFKYDRRWMLVDETQHNFIHARLFPIMLLINITIEEDNEQLIVTAPGQSPLTVPFASDDLDDIGVRLWSDKLTCKDHGEEIAQWFSTYLKAKVRLVQMTYDNPRMISECETHSENLEEEDLAFISEGDEASMAEVAPFLAICEESMTLLNTKSGVDYEIPYKRFRPNLLLKGGGPHDEDNFAVIEIAGHRFKTLGGCPRCIMTTIDPDRGEFTDDMQPLTALRKYRPDNGIGPIFGNLLIPDLPVSYPTSREVGKLSVGDKVNVIEWRERSL